MPNFVSVPQRVALMLMDSDERIRSTYDTLLTTLDSAMRPAWSVTFVDGDYTGGAQSIPAAKETYTLSFWGEFFGQGAGAEYELKTRELVNAGLMYILRRPTLVFSNQRSLTQAQVRTLYPRITEVTPLRSIAQIEYVTVTVPRFGLVDEGNNKWSWGADVRLNTVGKVYDAREVIT